MPDWLALLLTVVLLGANGFFVAAEFALVAARRSLIEPLAERGGRGARSALRAMERVSLMMAGAQLGITICSLALGALSEPAIAHLLEPVFHALHVPAGASHPIAFVLALTLVTVLHVVLGEVIPKNIALSGPERASTLLAPPLVAVVAVFRPLIAVLNALVNLMIRAFGVEPKDEVASTFDRDQVAAMVSESHREGHLDADEAGLLRGVIGFADRVAADVLLPLDALVLAPAGAPGTEIEELAARTGFSRFPLAGLRGYVHVKDVLATTEGTVPVRELPGVAADAELRGVLEVMRSQRAHIARVDDDGGRPLGVVTLQDVLSELVGTRN